MTHPPGSPPGPLNQPVARLKPAPLRALLRFGTVGAAGVLVNLAVLQLLVGGLGWGFTRSSAIATEAAIISNYIGNELWTFHLRRLHLGRLGRFNLVSLAALVVTVTVATVVKEFIDYRLAQLVGIACGAAVNFLVNFRWTWR